MADIHPLSGSCSCGRYTYMVAIPQDSEAKQQAQVHFGTTPTDRRLHSSLLSAFLKVPITWYRSTTIAFLPDERHDLISRTFAPPDQPGFQRKFCGYCGTNISYWTEQPIEEQEYLNVALGSLRSRDLHALDDLGLLDSDETDKEGDVGPSNAAEKVSASDLAHSTRSGNTDGMSWFEDIINGSRLGQHVKTRKGQGQSADGTTTVQWEISEYYGDDAADAVPSTRSKRKAGDIATDDVPMND